MRGQAISRTPEGNCYQGIEGRSEGQEQESKGEEGQKREEPMGRGEIWLAVIGSAAVGALISTIIVGINGQNVRGSRSSGGMGVNNELVEGRAKRNQG